MLEAAGALATVTAVGLAGCSESSDDGTEENDDDGTPTDTAASSCETPGSDLKSAFPDDDAYELQDSDVRDEGETQQDEVVRAAMGVFTDGNDDRYSLRVLEYTDAETAQSVSEQAADESSTDEGVIGYLVVREFAYVGFGPSEDALVTFLESSSLLEGCVEGNISFV